MALLRHRDDARGSARAHRYQMREKLLSIGDDSWIEDDQGERIYKVDGKAMRVRDTFLLLDRDGNEAAKIQERKLRLRGVMKIERHDRTIATVEKKIIGIRDRFDIDIEHGDDLNARGNILEHEYEIKRDGDVVATVSKRWLRVRDTYGIEIADGEDDALLLAVTVAIDDLVR
jgi:uncharacterized protein YxjI